MQAFRRLSAGVAVVRAVEVGAEPEVRVKKRASRAKDECRKAGKNSTLHRNHPGFIMIKA
jgi:DNA/RNA-binding domain of Phe-tRNA-synthetase-like protein